MKSNDLATKVKLAVASGIATTIMGCIIIVPYSSLTKKDNPYQSCVEAYIKKNPNAGQLKPLNQEETNLLTKYGLNPEEIRTMSEAELACILSMPIHPKYIK